MVHFGDNGVLKNGPELESSFKMAYKDTADCSLNAYIYKDEHLSDATYFSNIPDCKFFNFDDTLYLKCNFTSAINMETLEKVSFTSEENVHIVHHVVYELNKENYLSTINNYIPREEI